MGLNPDKIKARRLRSTLTMQELAIGMGWKSRQKWNDFERDKLDVQLSTLINAARLLNCSVADLIDETHTPRRGKT